MKSLLRAKLFWIVLSIGITVSIAILSLVKLNKAPVTISNIDKIGHAVAYFSLTFSWLQVFLKKRRQRNIIVFCCLIYGIIIEVLQGSLTNYRSSEFYDILANALGITLAFAIVVSFFKKK